MKKTAKAPSSKSGPVIRVAAITNAETKRTVYVRVTAEGKLGKRDAEHLGVKKVASWVEVEATRWADATKVAKAGKGKVVRAGREKSREQLKRAA